MKTYESQRIIFLKKRIKINSENQKELKKQKFYLKQAKKHIREQYLRDGLNAAINRLAKKIKDNKVILTIQYQKLNELQGKDNDHALKHNTYQLPNSGSDMYKEATCEKIKCKKFFLIENFGDWKILRAKYEDKDTYFTEYGDSGKAYDKKRAISFGTEQEAIDFKEQIQTDLQESSEFKNMISAKEQYRKDFLAEKEALIAEAKKVYDTMVAHIEEKYTNEEMVSRKQKEDNTYKAWRELQKSTFMNLLKDNK